LVHGNNSSGNPQLFPAYDIRLVITQHCDISGARHTFALSIMLAR
jgi:hypothetical protein